jgi:PAS domain S-box-containing protein
LNQHDDLTAGRVHNVISQEAKLFSGHARRYTIAVVAAVIAIVVRMAITQWIDEGRYTFILPLAAVAVVGSVAGLGPALFTLILDALAASYLLLAPKFAWAIDDPQSIAGMVIYLSAGLICALIASQSFRLRLKAQASQHQSDEQAQRLSDTLAGITDVFFTLDRTWCFSYVNQPAVMRFERDVLGHNLWDVFPAAVGNRAYTELQRAMTERVTVDYEVFYEPWQRWFKDRAYPMTSGGLAVYSQDITASKQQAAALAASEARSQQQLAELEAIYLTAPIGLCVLDRDLRYQRINANLAEINGLPVDAHIGKTVRELLPTLADQAEKMLNCVLESGESERVEFRGETPAQPGVERIWDEHWFPLRHRDTQDIIGVCAVVDEVTQRVRAEAELRKRTQQLESLVTSAPIGLAFFDHARRYLRVNDELAFINGIPAASHLGRTIEELLPAMAAHIVPILDQVLSDGKPIRYEAAGETPREPGVLRHWLCGFYPAHTAAAGQINEVGAWVVEITERKRAEEALHASEQRMQLAMSIAHAGTWDYDYASGKSYWSTEHFLLLGYPPAPDGIASFAMWQDLIVPEDAQRVQAEWDQAIRTHSIYRSEHRLRRADNGQIVWVSAAGRGFYDDAGKPLRSVGAFFDVTAQKEAERALLDADKRKDEFLATLAHELRNPLAPIRSGLHLLSQAGITEANQSRLTSMMERQIAHMVRLVDDLLEVSRINSGKIELRLELVDLRDVVANAVEVAAPLIEAAGHQLVLHLPPEAVAVNADPVRLAQVVANLLNNAAKYTEPGGRVELLVRAECHSDIAQDGHCEGGNSQGNAVLSVRDNGMGIPREMLPRVFDLFTQVDRTLGRAQGGLGIGLSLVKNLVELHGGKVHVRSDGPGCGSEFSFWLPLRATSNEVGKLGLRRETPPDGELTHLRILVVDDNRDAADTLTMLLQMMGAAARSAFNGPDALAALHADRPDIVFLDLGMPGMDGYAVAKIVRSDPRYHAVKLVALSGWGQLDDRRRTREAGFDCHVVKPIDPNELTELIKSMRIKK